MKSSLDSARIEFPCPHCGKKHSETVAKLKHKGNTELVCTGCGQRFVLDKTQVSGDLAKVENALAKTLGAFRRLGK